MNTFKYMDQNKEDNISYIKNQKTQIDKMLDDFNYRPAFTLLVQTLSRLDEPDIKDFIKYYYDFIFNKYTNLGVHINPVARY
jgi:hypothetical protein